MKNIRVLGFFFLLACSATKQDNQKKVNELINESSPYLLAHAYNPVQWRAWSEKVLTEAKISDKPLIISIGYAACHWCHVMEQESFSDTAVARIMNDNFINIKVDREERPDIDQIYLDAAALLTQNVGWPLNIVAMPDGTPIYATSYLPKEEWMVAIERLADLYANDRQRLKKQADLVKSGIKTQQLPIPVKPQSFGAVQLQSIANQWKNNFDRIFGGYNENQKFPLPSHWMALWELAEESGDSSLFKHFNITLERMAKGGLYDHIGGGFYRYTTDRAWKVPHFEKMLCDNAQMLSLYSRAYRLTNKKLFERVLKETAFFLESELMTPDGVFFTSLDADSDGEEGKYYGWKKSEIQTLLSEKAEDFALAYNVRDTTNWEHGNILYIPWELPKPFKDKGLTQDSLYASLDRQREILRHARSQRQPPAKDTKILTSWNALTIKGFVDAYIATGQARYLKTAQRAAQFLLSELREPDGRLNHTLSSKRMVNGFLEDYAFLIEALIALYQADFDQRWLFSAKELCTYVTEHFSNSQSPLFYYTSDLDAELYNRKVDVADAALPSANSVMCRNLLYLGNLLSQEKWVAHSQQMAWAMQERAMKFPNFYPFWVSNLIINSLPLYEVAILGRNWESVKRELERSLGSSRIVFLGGAAEGQLELLHGKLVNDKTLIYVCVNKTCKRPTESSQEALKLISRAR